MKLQFKHQKFQTDAVKAVVDVFSGQPYLTSSYRMDKGIGYDQAASAEERNFTGWSNAKIVPELSDTLILEHINEIQRKNQIAPSARLEGKFNLTIEMETGVGKTYTYIKTMYELNKQYGWSKFIVVVPSIAVREGVYQSFQATQEHFAEEYGRKIHFFIYDSSDLIGICHFASDRFMSVMIINSQAFNTRGKDARRIYMSLDAFKNRRPIDIIAETNPIMIIDEPQSVEGKQTKKNLHAFHPLMTLRYSATHKPDSIYNMVYRLDALEAYNKRLVKRIAVKGITEIETAAADSYVYLESIHLSRGSPSAVIQFDVRGVSGIRKKSRRVGIGFDLYDNSGKLLEYKEGFIVKNIDGRDNSLEFANGVILYAGDIIGKVNEDQLRRIQIRETILSHIECERQLFHRGIKVLSLFFIDEVAHYKEYDAAGQPQNGIFARMFEEEYQNIIDNLQREIGDEEYMRYLNQIAVSGTHAGYFSVDKKGRAVNRIAGDNKKSGISNDIDAYDLIMKNKELLLERNPKKSPVRFIFSHSALREGWDNPNVFQICTLKQSGSEVRKRQEVGRGLRLCVNQDGERMDENILGSDVHNVNVLTVIASESYDSFSRGLQAEIFETAAEEMKKCISDEADMADAKLHPKLIQFENARSNNIELQVDQEKLNSTEFKELWSKINSKSVYTVDFDTDDLVKKAIALLNSKLCVSGVCFKVESGQMITIHSKEELLSGESMVKLSSVNYDSQTKIMADRGVRYDLVGELANETGLTRKDIIQILAGIRKDVFDQFKENPEEFMTRAAFFINEQKAAVIMKHITYEALDEKYHTDIFTKPVIRGKLGINAMKTKKHLYDHLVYDSVNEKVFAQQLEVSGEVALYVKLPEAFCISTPAGYYHPDWAIAFHKGTVKHMNFIAETKRAVSIKRPCLAEELKLHCAREHFRAVSKENIVCDVIDSYESLIRNAME